MLAQLLRPSDDTIMLLPLLARIRFQLAERATRVVDVRSSDTQNERGRDEVRKAASAGCGGIDRLHEAEPSHTRQQTAGVAQDKLALLAHNVSSADGSAQRPAYGKRERPGHNTLATGTSCKRWSRRPPARLALPATAAGQRA